MPLLQGFPVTSTKAKPYSMDNNIPHCSHEAGDLEDPSKPSPDMWTRTADPQPAPDKPVAIALVFKQGLPVKLSVVYGRSTHTDGFELFVKLNRDWQKRPA